MEEFDSKEESEDKNVENQALEELLELLHYEEDSSPPNCRETGFFPVDLVKQLSDGEILTLGTAICDTLLAFEKRPFKKNGSHRGETTNMFTAKYACCRSSYPAVKAVKKTHAGSLKCGCLCKFSIRSDGKVIFGDDRHHDECKEVESTEDSFIHWRFKTGSEKEQEIVDKAAKLMEDKTLKRRNIIKFIRMQFEPLKAPESYIKSIYTQAEFGRFFQSLEEERRIQNEISVKVEARVNGDKQLIIQPEKKKELSSKRAEMSFDKRSKRSKQ